MLLDSAVGQIRDAKLLPVRANIFKIGEALSSIFEIQHAIDKQAPELGLEPKYEKPPEEVVLANRRLGEAILAADDLAVQGNLPAARDLLINFAALEQSEYHKGLALRQAARYATRNDV